MIQFVNAKINLGLNIVGKREDGYHLLETMFYPIGVHNGRPENPERFNDMLEINPVSSSSSEIENEEIIRDEQYKGIVYLFLGNKVQCEIDKHLVVRAAREIFEEFDNQSGTKDTFYNRVGEVLITLYKQLPDGAGMGGGSADASFTLRMINEIGKKKGLKGFDDTQLEQMALRLGADCPVFIKNRPAYAEGIGEKLEEMRNILDGKWCVVVKPDLYISTKEAFAGVRPEISAISIKDILKKPLNQWKDFLKNDFETSLFPQYPQLKNLKDALYATGALYASMTGSGAALYGIYETESDARKALDNLDVDFKVICKM